MASSAGGKLWFFRLVI